MGRPVWKILYLLRKEKSMKLQESEEKMETDMWILQLVKKENELDGFILKR